jgi:hypothetical protein
MTNTAENISKVTALKTIKETQWVGNLTFDSLDKCLTSMNFNTLNSGWYKAAALRINGLKGIFMLNEDGGLNFEQKVTKLEENKFLIESLSNEGFNQFENKYCELI